MRVVAKAKERPVGVRFAPGIIEKLDEVAIKQGRSRNTEINIRLAESLGLKKTALKLVK